MRKHSKKKRQKKVSFSEKMKKKFNKIINIIFDDNSSVSSFSIFEVVIIILISILFGVMIGYIITYSRGSIGGIGANSELRDIVVTYDNIVENYYGKIDKKKLSNAAIKGMVESLDDPYSNYMDSSVTTDFNDTIDGYFVGIGVVVSYENDYNTIIEIMKGGSAEKSGLKENDVIIGINGKSAKGIYGDKLQSIVRGKVGTNLKLKVRRGEEEKTFVLKRAKVEIQSVFDHIFDYENKSIGYIRIESFASNTYKQFLKSLRRVEKKGVDALIIDVRNNPGGQLLQTKQILNLFFNRKTILYQIKSKNLNKKVYADNNKVRSYPVGILINHESASASEVFASCFKENYEKSIIVGEASYGKGTVQKTQSLIGGSSIKYTTQKWLTSKGKWLNRKGVKPDIIVEQGEEYLNNPNYNTDTQLQELLSQIVKESNHD